MYCIYLLYIKSYHHTVKKKSHTVSSVKTHALINVLTLGRTSMLSGGLNALLSLRDPCNGVITVQIIKLLKTLTAFIMH